MRLIHTNDGKYYCRWVNLIPAIFLPGSAQYLAGRRTAGIACFVLYALVSVLLVGYLVHPKTDVSILAMGAWEYALDPLWFAIAIDGLRRPIRRLDLKGWSLFFGLWVCLLIVPALVIAHYVVQPFKAPSGAMQPTIRGMREDAHGKKTVCDHILINKWVYRFAGPQRGDVVAFSTRDINVPSLTNRNDIFVNRLVGLPGERISIHPPHILVNDVALTNPPIFQKISEGRHGYGGYVLAQSGAAVLKSPCDTITLAADEYLVLGDNSRNSLDGRCFGPIKRRAILGKVFYIYAPADRKRKIE